MFSNVARMMCIILQPIKCYYRYHGPIKWPGNMASWSTTVFAVTWVQDMIWSLSFICFECFMLFDMSIINDRGYIGCIACLIFLRELSSPYLRTDLYVSWRYNLWNILYFRATYNCCINISQKSEKYILNIIRHKIQIKL